VTKLAAEPQHRRHAGDCHAHPRHQPPEPPADCRPTHPSESPGPPDELRDDPRQAARSAPNWLRNYSSDPSFPPSEFEELKREMLTTLQSQLDNPDNAVERCPEHALQHLSARRSPLPCLTAGTYRTAAPGDDLDEVIRYQRDLIGTARGEIAIVGDFDEQVINDELLRLFPGARLPIAVSTRRSRVPQRAAAANRDRHPRQGKRFPARAHRHPAARRRSRRCRPVRGE
jgi:hypothetical protein